MLARVDAAANVSALVRYMEQNDCNTRQLLPAHTWLRPIRDTHVMINTMRIVAQGGGSNWNDCVFPLELRKSVVVSQPPSQCGREMCCTYCRVDRNLGLYLPRLSVLLKCPGGCSATAQVVQSSQHRGQSTQGLVSRSIRSISSLAYRHPFYFGVRTGESAGKPPEKPVWVCCCFGGQNQI